MSGFVAFRLVAEMRKHGFAALGASPNTVANACANMGAASLEELVGVAVCEAEQMENVPMEDWRRLQVLSFAPRAEHCIFRLHNFQRK